MDLGFGLPSKREQRVTRGPNFAVAVDFAVFGCFTGVVGVAAVSFGLGEPAWPR